MYNLNDKKMKTLDKQSFANLVLDIYANFLKNFRYDAFYDIARLRTLEEKIEGESFHIYFRKTGADLLFNTDNNSDDLHQVYLKRSSIVLYVNYLWNIDHNSDQYVIQIIKDDTRYLKGCVVLKE